MPSLAPGAKQLPVRHLSIRVPWHDTDWTGRVCQKPAENISCLILPRIRETRDDGEETAVAGSAWADLPESQLPPCVSERSGFMNPVPRMRRLSHPYSQSSKAHQHFLPTPFRYPSYSAACLPFAWMLKENVAEKVEALELGFEQGLEDEAHQAMGFDTTWVQTKHNQLTMLDTFFSAIQPKKSLCFFYAKRTPLVEDSRRVLIGVGWVTHVGEFVEYDYSEQRLHNSVIWERSVQHSIRPDFKDGFLLPYHEALNYLDNHPEENPTDYVAFAPDEHFDAFSYASEHVTNDGAIASLLACAKALKNLQRIVSGQWEHVQSWISNRLNELWQMRGPYPGLGAALSAFGINQGTLLALEIERKLVEQDESDPWPLVDQLLRAPENQPANLNQYIGRTYSRKWQALTDERRALLKLLSRFELTSNQATRFYVHEEKDREKYRIEVSDAEILANPCLLYECDRQSVNPIPLAIVDRGLYPDGVIREQYPVPLPSRMDDALDERRVRSFVVRQLERASENGHTLLPRTKVIQEIRELDVQPNCPVDGDLMMVVEGAFSPVVQLSEMQNGDRAYQLSDLTEIGQIIRRTVQRRLKAKRHAAAINWRDLLDEALDSQIEPGDIDEERAREEKTAALHELFSSRISVLIGPAGTGKTTLLKVLVNEPSIAQGGVLALAPTGKARVRMEQQMGISGAKTVAQFLLPLDRYEPSTGAYRLSNYPKFKEKKTVIIDEASMLTEAQLAAMLDGLSGVQRLILVGDHRQLPPIGAGRPFLDIVTHLTPENASTAFPRIAQGFAELTILRRQQGKNREDLELAQWFSGRELDPGADEIWSRIRKDYNSKFLRFASWQTAEDLQDTLLKLLADEIAAIKNREDVSGFEQSLGGSLFNGSRVFFWEGKNGEPGACAKIEDWQILSPVRNAPHGVEAINRFIQNTFRKETKKWATSRYRKIPKPMGREEILYGDKVINLKNHRHHDVWPRENALKYVANGEIGIVVGQYKTKYLKKAPWKMEVEFSSQPDFKYGYGPRDFSDEGDPSLELAYILTIHKVQGSEFDLTFLIVPNPCRLLSRELLYTALTRQKNKVVVLYQGEIHDLKKYTDDHHSDAAKRLTNLFVSPNLVESEDTFLEKNLIHITRQGDRVRSKSEVVIADLLYSKGIEYGYEMPFTGSDGRIRYPDFTFEDDDMGITYYWEHLGMMNSQQYRERWARKLDWYREQGILPEEDGGGEEGTLIITQDDSSGGIQSNAIETMLDDLLG